MDGEGHSAERTDGRNFHDPVDHEEENLGSLLNEFVDGMLRAA